MFLQSTRSLERKWCAGSKRLSCFKQYIVKSGKMVSIKFESQYYHVWKCKRLHGKNNKINRENDLKKRKNCAIQRKQRACIDINFA